MFQLWLCLKDWQMLDISVREWWLSVTKSAQSNFYFQRETLEIMGWDPVSSMGGENYPHRNTVQKEFIFFLLWKKRLLEVHFPAWLVQPFLIFMNSHLFLDSKSRQSIHGWLKLMEILWEGAHTYSKLVVIINIEKLGNAVSLNPK